jgi:hypothetical protein
MIERLFNVSKGTLRWHYKTSIAQATKHRAIGLPPILSQEEHDGLIGRILEAYTSNRAWTMRDIISHITDRYQKNNGRQLGQTQG